MASPEPDYPPPGVRIEESWHLGRSRPKAPGILGRRAGGRGTGESETGRLGPSRRVPIASISVMVQDQKQLVD